MFCQDPENPGNPKDLGDDGVAIEGLVSGEDEYLLSEVEKMFLLAAERGDLPSVKR